MSQKPESLTEEAIKDILLRTVEEGFLRHRKFIADQLTEFVEESIPRFVDAYLRKRLQEFGVDWSGRIVPLDEISEDYGSSDSN